jgi:ribosomal-protein-alanine N-acetyltransferase
MQTIKFPRLETERLVLRLFTLDDVPEVARLAGDKKIADTTAQIPHPYNEQMAEEWIESHLPLYQQGKLLNFAVDSKKENSLVGTVGFVIEQQHQRAELGYWFGVRFWGNGYCTEAARVAVDYALSNLKLNKITARVYSSNPASSRVLSKLGFTLEGVLKENTISNGIVLDEECWAKFNT